MTEVIYLATLEKQNEISGKVDLILEKLNDELENPKSNPLDDLILTGAFTAEPTVSNINWIWSSNRIGKVISLMYDNESDKSKFRDKTDLNSIFHDSESRKLLINTPTVLDTAMRSNRGVKLLFIQNIDVVIEMLKSPTACNYILDDELVISKILNTPEDFNKFWSAYKSDEIMRNNILNSKNNYFNTKMNKNQDVLEYLMNYESGTNYLSYLQIFRDSNSIATLVNAEKFQYNYMELVSLLMEPNNLLISCNLGLNPVNYIDSQDNRVREIVMTETAMEKIAASSTAMEKIAASSTAMEKIAASSTAMEKIIASSTAMEKIAASSTAMEKIIASSTALNSLYDKAKTLKGRTPFRGKALVLEISSNNSYEPGRYGECRLSKTGSTNWGNYKSKFAYLKEYKDYATYIINDTESDDWVKYFEISNS